MQKRYRTVNRYSVKLIVCFLFVAAASLLRDGPLLGKPWISWITSDGLLSGKLSLEVRQRESQSPLPGQARRLRHHRSPLHPLTSHCHPDQGRSSSPCHFDQGRRPRGEIFPLRSLAQQHSAASLCLKEVKTCRNLQDDANLTIFTNF